MAQFCLWLAGDECTEMTSLASLTFHYELSTCVTIMLRNSKSSVFAADFWLSRKVVALYLRNQETNYVPKIPCIIILSLMVDIIAKVIF